MSNNRSNLKNALTGMYLSGKQNVYKIKSPNGRHSVLVNKNSLAQLLNRNNIHQINRMISKKYPLIARGITTRRNYAYSQHVYGVPYLNNLTPINNYEFRKWNNNRGMIKPRGPFGGPIKLRNTTHYRLTNKNLRNIRSLRRQNTKNAENFARAQTVKRAANNAERRKYIYRVKFPDLIDQRRFQTKIVNSNGKQILFPKNAEPVTGPHNLTHIRRFLHTYFASIPNYNLSRISIYPYRIH